MLYRNDDVNAIMARDRELMRGDGDGMETETCCICKGLIYQGDKYYRTHNDNYICTYCYESAEESDEW